MDVHIGSIDRVDFIFVVKCSYDDKFSSIGYTNSIADVHFGSIGWHLASWQLTVLCVYISVHVYSVGWHLTLLWLCFCLLPFGVSMKYICIYCVS